MSWKFIDGKFYVNTAGNIIYYLEVNPCGCCPNSMLIFRKGPIDRRVASFTLYFDNYIRKVEDYITYHRLRVLE